MFAQKSTLTNAPAILPRNVKHYRGKIIGFSSRLDDFNLQHTPLIFHIFSSFVSKLHRND
eukprot:UN19764